MQSTALSGAASSHWPPGWRLLPWFLDSPEKKFSVHYAGFCAHLSFPARFCKLCLASASCIRQILPSESCLWRNSVSFGRQLPSSFCGSVRSLGKNPTLPCWPWGVWLICCKGCLLERGKISYKKPEHQGWPQSFPVPMLAFGLFQQADEGEVWRLLIGKWCWYGSFPAGTAWSRTGGAKKQENPWALFISVSDCRSPWN